MDIGILDLATKNLRNIVSKKLLLLSSCTKQLYFGIAFSYGHRNGCGHLLVGGSFHSWKRSCRGKSKIARSLKIV